MIARVVTVAFEGVEARRVDVEVQVSNTGGVEQAFFIVGLADKAVTESRERVRAAFLGLGLALPKRVVVNLAPADVKKEGSHYDLLDRIDLQIEVPAVTAADLALPPPVEGTAEAAARVAGARAVQDARGALNARLEGEALTKAAALDEAGRALLTRAAEAGHLTARGWTRTLRLARTIADLDGSGPVRRLHVAEALIYRRTGAMAEGAVA